MPRLVVHEPGRVAIAIPLGNRLSIGRDDDCELVVSDSKVSRRHAEIVPSDDGHEIADLGSTHGTSVNGDPTTRRRLSFGDRIQVGGVLLVYEDAEPEEVVLDRITSIEPSRDERRLRLLYDLAAAIGAAVDPDDLLARSLDGLLAALGCERGVVGILEGTKLRRLSRRREGGAADDVVLSRALLASMLDRRECVLARAEDPDVPATMVRERVRLAMGAPLVAGDRLLGFVLVDDRVRDTAPGTDDLAFLGAAARLVAAALDAAERLERAARFAEALRDAQPGGDIIGASDPMQRLLAQVAKVAPAAGTHVLVRGESGSGKELVARALHARSPRSAGPFVALNCAAVPDTMVESELFGHEKGAFTGAVRAQRGKFALAHGGTLFLDEIGELSPAAQAKLLRAVELGETQPLGSDRTVRVDVRVICATHKDLFAEIAERRFREDLYYRLAVVEITVPSLRERGDDVELLAHAFLAAVAPRVGKRLRGFTRAALSAFRRHHWPGNVRELANEVERAAILVDGEWIDEADLSPRVASARSVATLAQPAAPSSLAEQFAALELTERALVEQALSRANGNKAEASRLLGITWIMLKRRLDRFGLNELG